MKGWSNGAGFTWFTNRSALPTDQENTWKLFSKLEIPITEAASIPLSIVYSNDATDLKEQKDLKKLKYVSGFVGVSYDFWATPKALRR